MLLTLVFVYLLVTIAIGLMAAKRVKSSADFAIAGRHLPLVMIITTTFATWFGSETVLGIPAKFVNSGLSGVVEDPFGAGTCLILVGMFFATKLYKMNLLTISDYYRERYGRVVEVMCSVMIMISYLGWVSAQVTALGLVFNVLSGGAISIPIGMVIGVVSILAYTLFGGMWSVAVTDFIQMIILVGGLSVLAVFAADQAGGADKVVALAIDRDMFAFVPMFLVVSAMLIMPEQAATLIADDPQKVLPTLVMTQMPFVMQVLFFGALLSAIKSCASATLLAPSVTFTENIWRQFRPHQSDQQELRAMRVTVLVFSMVVLGYAIRMQGTSIYEMVSGAYQVPLVGAFVPLTFGLYWKRATTQGAIFALVFGLLTWGLFLVTPAGEEFPAQLAGVLASLTGMLVGSLGPQAIRNTHSSHHKLMGAA